MDTISNSRIDRHLCAGTLCGFSKELECNSELFRNANVRQVQAKAGVNIGAKYRWIFNLSSIFLLLGPPSRAFGPIDPEIDSLSQPIPIIGTVQEFSSMGKYVFH